MKNFSRHYFLLFLGPLFLLLVSLVLIYLDGYQNIHALIYFASLFLFFQLLFFTFYYLKEKNFWQFLKNGDFKMLQGNQDALSSHVFHHFSHYQKKQETKIKGLKETQETQQLFTELWIHQMKTPVTVIDLLSKEDVISKRELQQENKRLKEGLDLALNVSRLTNFSEDFILKRHSLKALCQKAINEEKESFVYRQIFPQVQLEDVEVIVDEKWFLFVLSQILQNSLKYTAAQGRIVLKAHQVNEKVQLEITDTGIGIPKKDLPRLTRPFFTGENGRKYPNATGMGLYLVKEITEKMDIFFKITSEKEKGTSILLTFNR